MNTPSSLISSQTTTTDAKVISVPSIRDLKIRTSKHIPAGQVVFVQDANILAAWNGKAWLYLHEGNKETNFEFLKKLRKEKNW
jgi:hypothetical protein